MTGSEAIIAPNSAGSGHPRLKAPPGAADCHMHIYDASRPQLASRSPVTQAGVQEYRLLQKRVGTTRVIVVQPRNHAIDNQVTLNAVRELGPGARGIAVLQPTVSDEELKRLDEGGIRGIRFSLGDPATAVVSEDMIEPLAARIAPLGWHVQLHAPGDFIAARAALLRRLPTPLVIDHMGRMPPQVGTAHPAFPVIRGLLDQGRTWVKLAGAYFNSAGGPPGYAGADAVAQAFVRAAPERLVWGSDWPHPSEKDKPDDARLFDLLSEWAPDEATRHRILVSNPEALYGFAG